MKPPMGWNSWNTFGSAVDETVVRETADALLDTGLAESGYRYVNVDDFWQAESRVDGSLHWDEGKFPSGIPDLADYLHTKNFKFGLYSCAGTLTCGGRPGSFGNEIRDADTFARWGVDFLKYDNCYLPAGMDGPGLYTRMGRALAGCGRSIVYSICEWGRNEPWTWGAATGASLWRVSGDIDDRWDSIVANGFQRLSELAPYAGPGRWNDPDMLVVGMHGFGNHEVADGHGCSDSEYRSHFALWCLTASPLIIGADVRHLDRNALSLLSNSGAIAISQDPLAVPARRIGITEHGGETAEVWSRPLSGGRMAVGLFNMGESRARSISVAWESLGLDPSTVCRVADVLNGGSDYSHRSDLTVSIDRHDCALVLLSPDRP